MSRYIDADTLIARLKEYNPQTSKIKVAQIVTNNMPTIDLVRCKECKWADKCSRNVAMQDTYQMYEKIDYCSYGERKESER